MEEILSLIISVALLVLVAVLIKLCTYTSFAAKQLLLVGALVLAIVLAYKAKE